MADPVDQKKTDAKDNAPVNPSSAPNAQPKVDQAEITKMAEELGMARKENETLKEYQERVNPVIETIWSDPELLKSVDVAHKKRLGIVTEPKKDDIKTNSLTDKKGAPLDLDTRDAVIGDIVNKFYDKHGINKLEDKAKGDINVKVGSLLKDFLDPNGNKKDLASAMQDASLRRLPEFLDRAYFLATKDEMLERAELKGKKETEDSARGVIGSFSSSSLESDSIALSPKDREIADNMGVSHEKFLARKKEIATRNNQLFK